MKSAHPESLFDDPAVEHRPTDRREFIREALRLSKTGLSNQDIAALLGLTAGGVADLLYEHRHGAPREWT